MSRFRSFVLLALAAVLLAVAGCGGGSTPTPGSTGAPKQHFSLPKSEGECPAARDGHGSMGVCAPRRLGLKAPHPPPTAGLPTYVDLSNNDPCYCGGAIRGAGHLGLIAKTNQGTGFIDWTAPGMIASARRAGLAVGGYDFDETYSVAEARLFVARLHAAGIWPGSRNTFPAVLDVEYGSFSLWGLRAQITYLERQGYRVAVYTGEWYWTPHAGCVWVARSAWLSGYPTASVPCGMASYYFHDHQYTEVGNIGAGRRGDVSVHFGSSFAAYVNNGSRPRPHPRPKPNRRQQEARLRALDRLLGDYNRHTNPHGHNCAHPPHPWAYPSPAWDHACAVWAGEANALRRALR